MNKSTPLKSDTEQGKAPEPTNPVDSGTNAMPLEVDIQALIEENTEMRKELQRVLNFANDRNIQIYAQAYIAAIGVKHPAPDVLATKCLTDLKNAFGMQNPAANH